MKIIINPFLSLLMLFAIAACSSKPPASDPAKTIVTPHLEQPITGGKNVVYCSSFQIAWNRLSDEVLKDRIILEGNPKIADVLNKQLSTKADISETAYVAMAGILTAEFLDNLNKELQAKFGAQAPAMTYIPQNTEIIAYAFLQKTLQFEKEFKKSEHPVIFHSDGQTTLLRGFGIESPSDSKDIDHLRSQVTVFNYGSDDNFIIGLSSKTPNDQMILAKITPDKTLVETIRKVEGKVDAVQSSHLQEDEPLSIPVIELDKKQSFTELKGQHITNPGPLNNYVISEALQQIKFRLNEKGAILQSEAFIAMASAPNHDIKRTFIFDKPFLIYLKQKGAKYPYFAMWVDNPDVLVSYKTQKPGVFSTILKMLLYPLRGMTTGCNVSSGAK